MTARILLFRDAAFEKVGFFDGSRNRFIWIRIGAM
jgi:hypothetical protein